jgi:serine/threonine protein kinase
MSYDARAGELVGAVFNGRWKLLRVLGEGGMGAVYEAQGVRGEGARALKVLHAEHVTEPAILDRFFAEALAVHQLDHPNVVTIHEHARAEDGTPYLVMELLRGESLGHGLRRRRTFDARQIASVGLGVLQALVVAHAAGIVHRDLKPDNIFLVDDGSGAPLVKVLDFGIAKVIDAAGGAGSKTKTGVLLGTPGYMSPEQVKDSKHVDERTDLWSVAVILYELVAGRPAFEADNEFAKLSMVLTTQPPPIAQVAPHAAPWGPFFERALAADIARRFQTAGEMAQALVQLVGAVSPARAASPVATLQLGAPAPAAASTLSSAMSPFAAGANEPSQHGTASIASGPSIIPVAPPSPAIRLHGSAAHPSAPFDGDPGRPTLPGGSGGPGVDVLSAPRAGAPWWLVAVVGVVGLALGFAAGYLAR